MNGSPHYARHAAQRKQMHYSPNLLNTIDNAIDNTLIAVIEYESNEREITLREIEPLAVVYKDRKRNLVGWCRLRNDYRSFRLDRLNMIKVKQEKFARREDFNIDNFQDETGGNPRDDYENEEA